MANEQFNADVLRFCNVVDDRIDYVMFGTAKELHSRLVDITPYRSGRARASWNIRPFKSDDRPAPDIGLSGWDADAKDLAAANVFYDSIIASKASFQLVPNMREAHITNTVHYIEKLNNGSSQQAPAGFFQATIASAPMICQRVVKGIKV